mmetsp:Transcript_10238/g.16733  ORF Transcript_10238/g.16733 Transcript_10238/m.16733 type:complete len:212 (-) Transcript_10238:3016-3651(-)
MNGKSLGEFWSHDNNTDAAYGLASGCHLSFFQVPNVAQQTVRMHLVDGYSHRERVVLCILCKPRTSPPQGCKRALQRVLPRNHATACCQSSVQISAVSYARTFPLFSLACPQRCKQTLQRNHPTVKARSRSQNVSYARTFLFFSFFSFLFSFLFFVIILDNTYHRYHNPKVENKACSECSRESTPRALGKDRSGAGLLFGEDFSLVFAFCY